ncbi:TIGR01777 family oxidoreductase [Winogradskyella endarachnes]|uniref:TIGR01777 family protein n=1 Tax=Winogradskyella endarachnes TaxID=2681965 RepID=A0A6L6UFE8_9FLAO|nr:TIGR01777 family oxidoreductase [Winogradskyella endarachnes]MUU79574.1 TIGR01777 family protein [Winogradskyella endarachnes]
MKTIIIAGGTGFLGRVLETHFTQKNYEVKILTRNVTKPNHIYWNAKDIDQWANHLEGTDVLINLTGKSVDCRYTEKNKKLIHDSRINSTNILGIAVKQSKKPPKVWLNMSTSTIYKDSYRKQMTEEHGDIGNDFSMNIAKSWEAEFNNIKIPNTKKVLLRTAIVLGKNGGALIPLKTLSKLGLGGKQWHGKQKVSWIHETDFARAIEFIIKKELNGVFNIVSPQPITNAQLMSSIRKVLKVPFGLPQPKWLIKLGAKLIDTEPELVLKSRNVIPENLTKNEFTYKYTTIESALNTLL